LSLQQHRQESGRGREFSRRRSWGGETVRKQAETEDEFDDEAKSEGIPWEDVQLTKEDLTGDFLPHGLIPPVRWEVIKLFGRLAFPVPPLAADSIRPREFVERLFKGKKPWDPVMTKDEFFRRVDNDWNFYFPSDGEKFLNDGELVWQAYMAARDMEEVEEDEGLEEEGQRKIRFPGQVPISDVMRWANKEINLQGVHPGALSAMWKFLSGGKESITRDEVIDKILLMVDETKLEWDDRNLFEVYFDTFYDFMAPLIAEGMQMFDHGGTFAAQNQFYTIEQWAKEDKQRRADEVELARLIKANAEWRRFRNREAKHSWQEMFAYHKKRENIESQIMKKVGDQKYGRLDFDWWSDDMEEADALTRIEPWIKSKRVNNSSFWNMEQDLRNPEEREEFTFEKRRKPRSTRYKRKKFGKISPPFEGVGKQAKKGKRK